MINNKELSAVRLSATKKDYYQIWNELIEVAGKISDRWDPATTNESDPGLVLLKVLTAIADKLNYNIDVNTLEAFMPSAAQMESMRSLCEMMGYNIKYYQSAATEVNIKLNSSAISKFADNEINELVLPMFTVVSNQEKDVNYVTIESKNFSAENTSQTIAVMEGQHVQCETINNNVVTIDMLDDNNRFYLPEHQIAENGIFIYRISDGIRSERWEKKESLHTEHFNNLIYKFGYDSKEARPYIQFPEDIGQIIDDGLEIHYIRTSGAAGNTAAFTLTTFESMETNDWKLFSVENDFTVNQLSAAMNGSNIESITDAYKNFKKTIGTFDTLVTCRDYMNKIYSLMETTNVPMVSNIIVSDIRDDINRSITLCSFNDFGICYTEKALVEEDKALIDHFDLVFYPFNTIYGYNNRAEYMSSFIYNADNSATIKRELADNKTIAHKIKFPNNDEIALIKNYLKLDARIVTTYKVSVQEEISILDAIKTAIYKNFNLRKLDFGEEIPFDSILDVIENADPRIKNVVLNEPVLLTKFMTVGGDEYELGSVVPMDVDDRTLTPKFLGRELYNKLTLRNILAGRIELFNYNSKFKHTLNESKALKPLRDSISGDLLYEKDKETGELKLQYSDEYYEGTFPNKNSVVQQITKLEPVFTLGYKVNDKGEKITPNNKNFDSEPGEIIIPKNYELSTNQEIKFRSPNFVTKITYPAYVNYFLHLSDEHVAGHDATPAKFETLGGFLNTVQKDKDGNILKDKNRDELLYWDKLLSWESFKNYSLSRILEKAEPPKDADEKEIEKPQLSDYEKDYGAIFYWKEATNTSNETLARVTLSTFGKFADGVKKDYYSIPASDLSLMLFKKWLTSTEVEKDLYLRTSPQLTRVPGYLVDEELAKYGLVSSLRNETGYEYLKKWFVPLEVGQDADYSELEKDCEYELRDGEYLLINYTPSSSSQTEDGTTTYNEGDPISVFYGPGCIIKPNFEMGDTAKLVNGGVKAYSKKNVNFTNCEVYKYGKEENSLRGWALNTINSTIGRNINMVGLGSDEQIEYRAIASVTLDKGYNLYWALNDSNVANTELSSNNNKYILKDNEYFFISGVNKDSMTYYGSGTEICLNGQWGEGFFSLDDNKITVSLEEILVNGITGIPWSYKLMDKNKSITITEYKYITLTDGDVLSDIKDVNVLSSKWQRVTDASYIISGESKKLPIIRTSQSSGWEVQSLLVLHTSSEDPIKLVEGEKIILCGKDGHGLEVAPEKCDEIIGDSENPIVIRSSYAINGAHESISTTVEEYTNSQGNQVSNDFMVSVSKEEPLGLYTASGNDEYVEPIVKLHNFGDNLTSVYFNSYNSTNDFIKFSLNIPEDSYGLLMMYYAKSTDKDGTEGAYLTCMTTTLTSESPLTIFNNTIDGVDSWWESKSAKTETKARNGEAITETRFYLKPGVNLIKIKNITNNIMLYPDARLDHSVIFSDLDIVYSDNDINLDLIDYQRTTLTDNEKWVNLADSGVTIQAIKSGGHNIEEEIIEYNKSTKTALYHSDGIINKNIKVNDNIIYYRNPNKLEDDKLKAITKAQLLEEINKMDPNHDFYYNCLPDNSIAIDINANLLGTEDAQTLSNPRIWFDCNNVNNKFVVSEIDAIYLEDGIQIARASKR